MTPHHLLLAAASSTGGPSWPGVLLVGLMGLVALAFLVLFVAALVSILGSRLSGGMKLVWVVFAFCAPFLGSLLWFVIGRKDARRAVPA